MSKVCIVLQGQLYPEILDELLFTYKDISNIILSTWNTENIDCINKCIECGFQVIIQDPPEYKTQANYMVKSLSAGFKKAIELGYTYVFRCRTDIKINDIKKLLTLLSTEFTNDKLSFITMFKNLPNTPEYLVDNSAYGPLDKLSKYWGTYQLPGDQRFPELFLMETYFKNTSIIYSDIKDEVNFLSKELYKNNIEFIFTKAAYRNLGNLIYTYYKTTHSEHFINEKNELNII
jgi:hypothetical protein